MSNEKKKSQINNFKVGDKVVLWDKEKDTQISRNQGIVTAIIDGILNREIVQVQWIGGNQLLYRADNLKLTFEPNGLMKEIV